MKSIISTKGRITVPAPIRDKLGLAPGTAVQFELREGGVLLRKGRVGAHPVDQVFGRLRLRRRVDALLDEMRGHGRRRAGGSLAAARGAAGRRSAHA
jgi:antitoxin PrlF